MNLKQKYCLIIFQSEVGKQPRFYAESCLDAGVSFINAIPVFIASDTKWQQSFQNKNLACAGDDVMSQCWVLQLCIKRW